MVKVRVRKSEEGARRARLCLTSTRLHDTRLVQPTDYHSKGTVAPSTLSRYHQQQEQSTRPGHHHDPDPALTRISQFKMRPCRTTFFSFAPDLFSRSYEIAICVTFTSTTDDQDERASVRIIVRRGEGVAGNRSCKRDRGRPFPLYGSSSCSCFFWRW